MGQSTTAVMDRPADAQVELRLQAMRLSEACARRARASFDAFVEYCFTDQTTGDELRLADFHMAQYQHIEEAHAAGMNAGILSMWGHGKTTLWSIARPLFRLGHDPRYTCKVICANRPEARKRVAAVREHIESNERLHHMFPRMRPAKAAKRWAAGEIVVDRPAGIVEPSYEAQGLMQTAMGSRAHELIFDDPQNLIAAMSPARRERDHEVFQTKWMTRLHAGCHAIFIGTGLHQDDIANRTMKRMGLQVDRRWAWLIQRVAQDFSGIECEVL